MSVHVCRDLKLALAMAALGVFSSGVAIAGTSDTGPRFDAGVVSGLNARNIGSAAMSGRVAALAARAEKDGKTTIFVGAASGGVWKSTDSGTTFDPVFDKQPVQSIGAIALDPSNPKNVWVGTGESWMRNSISVGDGIYKSSDGGQTWTDVGLPNSEHIAKILVDPGNGDTVYACVAGKLWSDSPDRGLYRTRDGGKSWTLVLKGSNLSTGCASISLDEKTPNVIFASLWDFRRKGWTFRSGGVSPAARSGSGLFRSADGGTSWKQVTPEANKGFPKKPYGRIAVAVAPSNSAIVYAFVESTDSALYRSDDGGRTWQQRDKSQMMVWRPFYFANLIVDPINPDRLFKPDLGLIMSLDGGKSFAGVSGGTHADHHVVWIDPSDTQHVITGDDGGLWQSFDGGNKWWKQNNLPISQFYHVSVDNADPFRVYGGLQDNSAWVGDSAYPGGITNSRWENMYGGDGFWMFEDPTDANYIYAEAQGGWIGRINRHTHEIRSIKPEANYMEKLRWNWNTPIALSPNSKDTLYIGAQFLFRSRDHGQSWQRISPDLTSNDPDKQKQEQSGGVTVDNSEAEMHTTIYAISESPKQPGLIWVGTDDGNLQITRDDGANWTNVVGNIKGLAPNSWVSWVQASPSDAATAYATFDRHTFGDMSPLIYKTTDFGRSWTALVTANDTHGLRGYVHVIREDPVRANILYAGTEFGLWISIDGGGQWAKFKGGKMPAVPVRDISFQQRDASLALATHGRGIWIIDDLTPLRALDEKTLASGAAFLPGKLAQQRIEAFGGWSEGDASFSGPNPPDGAQIFYYQKSRHLFGKLKIEVLGKNGEVLDTIPASVRRGINRVSWSMRTKPPHVPPAAQIAGSATQGARVPPGTYQVRMTKGDQVYTTSIDVKVDRRVSYNAADRQAQFDAAQRVSALFGDMSDLVAQISAVRAQAAAIAGQEGTSEALHKTLGKLSEDADAIRKKIVATTEGGAITGEERLREHTDQLYGAITGYEGRPTDYQLARIDVLYRELGDVQKKFATFRSGELAKVNRDLESAGMKRVTVPPASATPQGSGNGSAEARGALQRLLERD